MTPIQIIKNRSDIGAGTRGSDMGIDAIEIAAINQDNDFFTKFDFVDVETHNETVYNKVKTTFAKRINHVRVQCERVAAATKNALVNNQFPLVMSGDHSSALGTISGVKAFAPDKRIGAVWIDAHADLHSPFTSPSGNVHGMPLAAALSVDNREHQLNPSFEQTEEEWKKMKNLGKEGPKILPQDLVFFGVRDTELPEDKLREEMGIKNYMVHEVRYRGLQVCLNEAIKKLSACDYIYISFDVDSMDCDLVSKGTGTPVSKGFDPDEAKSLIKGFLETGKVVCLEIAEVNPLLDMDGNKMAETAFSIMEDATETILKVIAENNSVML